MASNTALADLMQQFLINFADDIRVLNKKTKTYSSTPAEFDPDDPQVLLKPANNNVSYGPDNKNIIKNDYENLTLCAIPNQGSRDATNSQQSLVNEHNLFAGVPLDKEKLKSLYMPAASSLPRQYVKNCHIDLLFWDLEKNDPIPYEFSLTNKNSNLKDSIYFNDLNNPLIGYELSEEDDNRKLYLVIGDFKISIKYTGSDVLNINNNLSVDIAFSLQYPEDISTKLFFYKQNSTEQKAISLIEFKNLNSYKENFGLKISYEFFQNDKNEDPFYMKAFGGQTLTKTIRLSKIKTPTESHESKSEDLNPYKITVPFLGSIQQSQVKNANLFDVLKNNSTIKTKKEELSNALKQYNSAKPDEKKSKQEILNEKKQELKELEKSSKQKLIQNIFAQCNIYTFNVSKDMMQIIEEDSSSIWKNIGIGAATIAGLVLAGVVIGLTAEVILPAAVVETATGSVAGGILVRILSGLSKIGATKVGTFIAPQLIGFGAIYAANKIGNNDPSDIKLNHELALNDYLSLKERVQEELIKSADIIQNTTVAMDSIEQIRQQITREQVASEAAGDSSKTIPLNFTFFGDFLNALNSIGVRKNLRENYETQPEKILGSNDINPEPILIVGNINLNVIARYNENSKTVEKENVLINIADIPIATAHLYKILEEEINSSSNFFLSKEKVIKRIYEYLFQNILSASSGESDKKNIINLNTSGFYPDMKTETFSLNSNQLTDLNNYFVKNSDLSPNNDDRIAFANNYNKISSILQDSRKKSNSNSYVKTFKYLGGKGKEIESGFINTQQFVDKFKELKSNNQKLEQYFSYAALSNQQQQKIVTEGGRVQANTLVQQSNIGEDDPRSVEQFFKNTSNFMESYIDLYNTPIIYPTVKLRRKRSKNYPQFYTSLMPLKEDNPLSFSSLQDDNLIISNLSSNTSNVDSPAVFNTVNLKFHGFMSQFISIGSYMFIAPSNVKRLYIYKDNENIQFENNRAVIDQSELIGLHKAGKYTVMETSYQVTIPFTKAVSSDFMKEIIESEVLDVKLNQNDYGIVQ